MSDGVGVDRELAGDSDQDDPGGLPAAVMRLTKPADALLVRLALRAYMNRVRRSRSLPMRLIPPVPHLELPKECLLGERPAKVAHALGRELGDVGQRGQQNGAPGVHHALVASSLSSRPSPTPR